MIFWLRLFLVMSIFISTDHYTRVLSWTYLKTPSLLLTDQQGVENTTNAIVATNTNAFIRIEDMSVTSLEKFTEVFVRFNKKRFSSYVVVNVYNVFDNQLITSIPFYDEGHFPLLIEHTIYNNIYLQVEIYGTDIELRSAGVQINPNHIMGEEDFRLNQVFLSLEEDILEITFTLQEEARVFLAIYNNKGNICTEFLNNKVLDQGEYRFYINPRELVIDNVPHRKYFVWISSENLRSPKVEYIKEFRIIP